VAVFDYLSAHTSDTLLVIIKTLAVALMVKFIVCPIFRGLTKHRGIVHSVPFFAITTMTTLLLLQAVNIPNNARISIAAALGAGYLGHLVLDEGKAFLHFRFLIFWSPRKSAGSALKFTGLSVTSTTLAYIMVTVLGMITLMVLD
jgi:hypothetical protein